MVCGEKGRWRVCEGCRGREVKEGEGRCFGMRRRRRTRLSGGGVEEEAEDADVALGTVSDTVTGDGSMPTTR